MVESLFTVDNPKPKVGGVRTAVAGAAEVERAASRRGQGRVDGPEDLRMTVDDAPIVPELSFEDRMATVEFRVAADAHIVVDGDPCRGCTTQECVTACPANLFVPTSDGGILFNYEECFECGTCYMICNTEGRHHVALPRGRPRRRLPRS